MGARRNSPRLSKSMTARILGDAPRPPQQHDLGGMITDDRAEFAYGIVKSKQQRNEEKKRAARQLEFEIRALELPKPHGYVNSSKEYSHEFWYCKDMGDTAWAPRDFRADYAWPEPQYRLLIELNGGNWVQGAHARPEGLQRDYDKQFYATILGWWHFAVSTDEVWTGMASKKLQDYFMSRGWRP